MLLLLLTLPLCDKNKDVSESTEPSGVKSTWGMTTPTNTELMRQVASKMQISKIRDVQYIDDIAIKSVKDALESGESFRFLTNFT